MTDQTKTTNLTPVETTPSAMSPQAPSWPGALQAPTPPTQALRTDGPTLDEYVKAGYDPANYPPAGYAAVPSTAVILPDQQADDQSRDRPLSAQEQTIITELQTAHDQRIENPPPNQRLSAGEPATYTDRTAARQPIDLTVPGSRDRSPMEARVAVEPAPGNVGGLDEAEPPAPVDTGYSKTKQFA